MEEYFKVLIEIVPAEDPFSIDGHDHYRTGMDRNGCFKMYDLDTFRLLKEGWNYLDLILDCRNRALRGLQSILVDIHDDRDTVEIYRSL